MKFLPKKTKQRSKTLRLLAVVLPARKCYALSVAGGSQDD